MLKMSKLKIRFWKVGPIPILVISLSALSGCGFNGCNSIKSEKEQAFQEYLDLRKSKYDDYVRAYNQWKKINDERNTKLVVEVAKCYENPLLFYRKSKNKRSIDFLGGFEAYKKLFGLQATCEALARTGIWDGWVESAPKDESASYAPAVEKYLLSMRIIKNNPRCFSATEVANAEQEIQRLNN